MEWKKLLEGIKDKSYNGDIPNDKTIMEAVASNQINPDEGASIIQYKRWLADDLANLCHFSSSSGEPVRKCSYRPNSRRSTQPCHVCRVASDWEEAYG